MVISPCIVMEIQMLKRKLQTTTKDSYFTTLPKSLIQALGLQKGDNLTITLDGKKIVLEQEEQEHQE